MPEFGVGWHNGIGIIHPHETGCFNEGAIRHGGNLEKHLGKQKRDLGGLPQKIHENSACMSKEPLGVPMDQFARRITELYCSHQNIKIGETVPEWVFCCLDRVTKEGLGPDIPDRNSPTFRFLVLGFLIGTLGHASEVKMNLLQNQAFYEATKQFMPHSWLAVWRRLSLRFKSYTFAQLAQLLQPKLSADLVAASDSDRAAFAQGLLIMAIV